MPRNFTLAIPSACLGASRVKIPKSRSLKVTLAILKANSHRRSLFIFHKKDISQETSKWSHDNSANKLSFQNIGPNLE